MAGVLLYDQDCGFCTRVAKTAPRLHLQIGICPMNSVELATLGVDPVRATREVPFVSADGTVSYGHRAIAAALRTGPLPLKLIGTLLVLPGLSQLGGLVYRTVAKNRHRLPGGQRECKL